MGIIYFEEHASNSSISLKFDKFVDNINFVLLIYQLLKKLAY